MTGVVVVNEAVAVATKTGCDVVNRVLPGRRCVSLAFSCGNVVGVGVFFALVFTTSEKVAASRCEDDRFTLANVARPWSVGAATSSSTVLFGCAETTVPSPFCFSLMALLPTLLGSFLLLLLHEVFPFSFTSLSFTRLELLVVVLVVVEFVVLVVEFVALVVELPL